MLLLISAAQFLTVKVPNSNTSYVAINQLTGYMGKTIKYIQIHRMLLLIFITCAQFCRYAAIQIHRMLLLISFIYFKVAGHIFIQIHRMLLLIQ